MQDVSVDIEDIWRNCLTEIQGSIPPQTFSTWFRPIVPLSLHNNKLTIQVPSRFHYEWIVEHYNDLLKDIVFRVIGYGPAIHYTVALDEKGLAGISGFNEKTVRVSENRSPSYTRLNSRYTFENFVEGSANQFAKAAAFAVGDAPGKTSFNPLLLYGGVGLGKTHLIQAIGNKALQNLKVKKIRYVSSEKFTLDFITAIQNNSTAEFSKLYRNIDLLLVDDIQFFTNKERTQEEFFHTFNELQQKGKQVVLSCDRPPSELKGLEERLISRFTSGLIADVQPPDLETRVAILQKKSDQDNIQIPSEVTIFVATNVTTNIRDLEGALIKILAHASLNGEDISLELTKRVLKDIIRKKNNILSIEIIQRIVCNHLNIKEDFIRAKTRKKEVVEARQISMYLSKQLTSFALKTIGLHFGGRDHSTVIHACQNIEKKIKGDKQFGQEVQEMRTKIELSV